MTWHFTQSFLEYVCLTVKIEKRKASPTKEARKATCEHTAMTTESNLLKDLLLGLGIKGRPLLREKLYLPFKR